MLLVFVLKIGAAAACAKHDFADLGLGADSQHGVVLKAPAEPEGQGAPAHAGACSHCSCHHAATVVPDTHIAITRAPQRVDVPGYGVKASADARLELRPPIV